jgi:hypothetical protein
MGGHLEKIMKSKDLKGKKMNRDGEKRKRKMKEGLTKDEKTEKKNVEFSKVVLAFSSSLNTSTSEDVINRVEVKITHSNNRKFNGFLFLTDVKNLIFGALCLSQSNLHGISFRRKKVDNKLFIFFMLRQEIEVESIHQKNLLYKIQHHRKN